MRPTLRIFATIVVGLRLQWAPERRWPIRNCPGNDAMTVLMRSTTHRRNEVRDEVRPQRGNHAMTSAFGPREMVRLPREVGPHLWPSSAISSGSSSYGGASTSPLIKSGSQMSCSLRWRLFTIRQSIPFSLSHARRFMNAAGPISGMACVHVFAHDSLWGLGGRTKIRHQYVQSRGLPLMPMAYD